MAVASKHLRKRISLHKSLKRIAQTFVATVLLISPALRLNAQTEIPPDTVVQWVHDGIASLHGYQAIPELYYYVTPGSVMSACGPIYGSAYCPLDHTIFITTDDINRAYWYGDAALAYIVAHEYAHAMQTAFGFMPRITPISELQADCLAGLYLGVIPNVVFDTSDLLEIGNLAYSIGDYDTWGAQHHGTPQQRMKAVSFGLDASSAGLNGARQCINFYAN